MNIIDLKSFCSRDETRPQLLAPFTLGEYTYATDGRILIRVSALADVPVLSADNDLAKAVLALFNADESDGNYQALPDFEWGNICKTCLGKGQTDSVACPHCSQRVPIPSSTGITCHQCQGTGRIVGDKPIGFGISYVSERYCAKVAKLPNAKLACHSTDPLSPLSIKFDSGEGRLMPMRVS